MNRSHTVSVVAIFLLATLSTPGVLRGQVDFEFLAPTLTVPLSGQETEIQFEVDFCILQATGGSTETQGYSMSVTHDPEILDVISIDPGAGLPTFPDIFFAVAHLDGWSVGVVYSHIAAWTLAFDTALPVVNVTYSALSPSLGQSSDLTWEAGLGSPPSLNTVIVGGIGLDITPSHGAVYLGLGPFLRGDMNGDGTLDLADIFTAEAYLFLEGSTPNCLAALDANGDGLLDIADNIYFLSYLFVGGPAPPAPFPVCGPAPIGSSLSCSEYDCP